MSFNDQLEIEVLAYVVCSPGSTLDELAPITLLWEGVSVDVDIRHVRECLRNLESKGDIYAFRAVGYSSSLSIAPITFWTRGHRQDPPETVEVQTEGPLFEIAQMMHEQGMTDSSTTVVRKVRELLAWATDRRAATELLMGAIDDGVFHCATSAARKVVETLEHCQAAAARMAELAGDIVDLKEGDDHL